jgi:cellulose synthase/poly-beta-1,6-N-acetylglucosamine synthase-like glycosyltransferase
MFWLFIILLLPYLITILDIRRNFRKIEPFVAVKTPSARISVIAACRNEENNLPLFLERLSLQDYNAELFEVIIVDDNSADNTFKIASEFKGLRNFTTIKNHGSGKKKAIRTAVNITSGDLIISTDADCSPGISWISSVSAYFEKTRADMIIAPVRLEDKPGFRGRFSELEFLSLQGITAGTAAAGNPVMCNGANLAFTKAVYLRHTDNLHDEILSGDDIFLLHALKKKKGSKAIFLSSGEAIVTTCQPDTLKNYLTQRARWISKAGAYDDCYTRFISIVTFLTSLALVTFLLTGIIEHEFLLLFLAGLILKSIPDYMLLNDVTAMYGKKDLLRWFIPSQFIYPFYVIVVSILSLAMKKRWYW